MTRGGNQVSHHADQNKRKGFKEIENQIILCVKDIKILIGISQGIDY
jgi:hypothetical protein